MSGDFARVPESGRFVLANATVPAVLVDGALLRAPDADGLAAADLTIADGRIERISAPGGKPGGLPEVDLDRGMLWPAFVDMHTHIDKGHIWPRRPNPDGRFPSALDATALDRAANWSAEDVARRMDFSLRCAYAYGTVLLRTHLDSVPPQHRISWPVFAEMRERWAGRIELQAVSLSPIDLFLDAAFAREIVAVVARHGGVLGAATFPVPGLEQALDAMMRAAADAGLDLDCHVDENDELAAATLRPIAEASIRNRFPGRIVVGHCCSLALQPPEEAAAQIALLRDAGIAVVSLPMCNLYLQDRRAGRTPRWRGVTIVQELAAAGVPVAIGSDNTRDPFYPYGDLDPLEVFREAVRILHLDHPIAPWPAAITRSPAAILGRPERGMIAVGAAADLVLFRARSWTELLARPQADRIVLRAGRAIDRTLPDYRELDDLVGLAQ